MADWIVQLEPLLRPEAQSPAWPYRGFWEILEEADAITAIRDQVEKLGPDFDRTRLQPFYRLLWLLNNTQRHKTLQGYVAFSNKPRQAKYCFFSEVLLGPFDQEKHQMIIDIQSVEALASEFIYRIGLQTDGHDADRRRIALTPIRTIFGQPPDFQWGYSLGLKAEAFADSAEDSVATWENMISMLVRVFDRTAAVRTMRG